MHTHTHSKVHPIIHSQYRRKTGIHLQPHWKRNWLWSLSKSYLLWNTCSRLFQPKSRICLRNFRSEKCNMTWRITSTSFLPFTYSEHMKESVNPQNTTSKMDTVKKQLQLDIFFMPVPIVSLYHKILSNRSCPDSFVLQITLWCCPCTIQLSLSFFFSTRTGSLPSNWIPSGSPVKSKGWKIMQSSESSL